MFDLKIISVTVAVLVAVQVISAQYIQQKSCPENRGVIQDFNLQKYMGKWHEILRYEQPYEKDGDCCSAEYSIRENGTVKVFNRCEKFPIPRPTGFEGSAILSYPDANPLEGKLNVSFFGMPHTKSNYWILDTDYENYSIIWGCTNMGPLFSAEAGWLLSRSKELNPDVQQKTDALVAEFFDRSNMRVTKQDALTCGTQ